MKRRTMYAVAISFALAAPVGTGAQTGSPNLDSLLKAVRDTMPLFRLNNQYDATIKGNVTRVSMGNRFSTTVSMRNGWTFSTNLSVDETAYRLQDRRDNRKNFRASMNFPLGAGFTLTGSALDNRFFNRLVTFSNALQDLKNDSQDVTTRVNWMKKIGPGVSVNAGTSGSVSRSDQTFLSDDTKKGSIFGQAGYNFGGRLKVKARAAASTSDQSADTGGTINDGLGVDEDSLFTEFRLAVTDSATVTVGYDRFTRTNEFMDLPRGVFQQQQFTGNLKREIETRTGENIRIVSTVYPVSRLKVDVTGTHRESVTDFLVAKNRFNRRVTDRIEGTATYTVGATVFDARLENRKNFNDLGAVSAGSFHDQRRSARFGLQHRLSDTFRFNVQTGASIVQSFYVDFETTPRDRDQLDQFVNVRINSSPFPKITTQIYLAVNQTDFINIDGSLSQNNRTETTYDFRPELTYQLTPRIEIRQTYGLNIEFTEFDFNENDNFLDRNFRFTNRVRTDLGTRLDVELNYELQLHDRGSYLRPSPTEERLLDIDQGDRRDRMTINMRYKISPHLTLVGRNDYTRRRDTVSGIGRGSIFTDGALEVGVEGAYKWGANRTLNLNLRKVRRFGRFNSPEQEDYWVMDSAVKYAF